MPRQKVAAPVRESDELREERRTRVTEMMARAQHHMDESQRLRKDAYDRLQAEHERWRLRPQAD